MRDPRELLPDRTHQQNPWFGTVAKTVTNFTEMVEVVIPEFDQNLRWGPMPWQARDATSFPVAGNKCLVVFDNRRDPWMIAWWPF